MRLDRRPVSVVRLTRTVISNGAHQEIEELLGLALKCRRDQAVQRKRRRTALVADPETVLILPSADPEQQMKREGPDDASW
jgi:hypothetical protein